MGFTEEQFARLRPFLYHLTSSINLVCLADTRLVQSAASLLNQAGKSDFIKYRRQSALTLTFDGQKVVIRDQQPLHEGNIALRDSWTFPQLLESLNRHVFFWPGSETKVISYGLRHFKHYAAEWPVILRLPFVSTTIANAPRHPLFCKYNSGSPRMVSGQRSPRGADTFVRAQACTFSAGEVVEVVYRDAVLLPKDTEWARTIDGPWFRLEGSAL